MRVAHPPFSYNSGAQAQALITAYRLAYQRHRTGAPGGAKGELSNLVSSLDVKAFRLLPAAQVAAMAAAEKGTKTTGQSDLLAGKSIWCSVLQRMNTSFSIRQLWALFRCD